MYQKNNEKAKAIQTIKSNSLGSLQSIKIWKQWDLVNFLNAVITFVSIVGAFKLMSESYRHSEYIETVINFNLYHSRSLSYILLFFSLHLITLKTLSFIFWLRDPSSVGYDVNIENNKGDLSETRCSLNIPYTDNPQEQQQIKIQSITLQTFSQFFEIMTTEAAYGFLSFGCLTYYVIFIVQKSMLSTDKISYLAMWLLCSNILYIFGSILARYLRLYSLQMLGFSMGVMGLGVMLGMCLGINCFMYL